jgi:hypothetical protein
MWTLNNQTPYAAERTWVRDKNGAEVWLIAVKGTFDILPDGTTQLSKKQEEVVLAPLFTGNPQSSSLLNDTDLPHKKLATDVLILGHAYAPEGKPVTSLPVGFKVANIQKIIQATGDRVWLDGISGLSMSDPIPFIKIPITYERAFGGMDLMDDDEKMHDWELRNPAGCGFATKANHLIGKPIPNFEYPGELISNWKQRPRPAGFGPIAGHWCPRVKLAGTYDENWEKTRLPLLPEDFNERYFQNAPEDQQVQGYLKGGEQVVLLNLTPTGKCQFHLPRVFLSFTTDFNDRTSQDHRAVLHTVILKPCLQKVVLVWHTHLLCHHKVLKLTKTNIRIKQPVLGSVQLRASHEISA